MDTKNITVIDMDINMKDYPEHEELIEILTEMQDCYQLMQQVMKLTEVGL